MRERLALLCQDLPRPRATGAARHTCMGGTIGRRLEMLCHARRCGKVHVGPFCLCPGLCERQSLSFLFFCFLLLLLLLLPCPVWRTASASSSSSSFLAAEAEGGTKIFFCIKGPHPSALLARRFLTSASHHHPTPPPSPLSNLPPNSQQNSLDFTFTMGLFGEEHHEAVENYDGSDEHKASLSHEVLGGAASFAAMKGACIVLVVWLRS